MTSNVLLSTSNSHFASRFGATVAVQGNIVVGGAPGAMNAVGAAYVFELP
jgi:predicted Rossmann-fold nucleotide-binding protein